MMEKFDIKELQGKMNDALSFVKNKIEGFVSEDEAFWMAVAMFLLGVIVGMFISPRRNLSIGSNNSTTTNKFEDPTLCGECDDSEDCED